MKSLILITAAAFLFPSAAFSQSSTSLRMETKIDGKASYSDNAAKTKTQARKLTVELTNTSDKPVGATFRWAIYGHTMKGNRLVVLKNGSQAVKVAARETSTVTSPEVKVTGNREQTVPERKPSKNQGGKKGKPKVTFRKIPAAGEEYYGYGVEILVDGKLVGSEYSKPSIGEEMRPGG